MVLILGRADMNNAGGVWGSREWCSSRAPVEEDAHSLLLQPGRERVGRAGEDADGSERSLGQRREHGHARLLVVVVALGIQSNQSCRKKSHSRTSGESIKPIVGFCVTNLRCLH